MDATKHLKHTKDSLQTTTQTCGYVSGSSRQQSLSYMHLKQVRSHHRKAGEKELTEFISVSMLFAKVE